MKKKKSLLVSALLFSSLAIATSVVTIKYAGMDSLAKADDVYNYWYHYEQVTPTLTKHGSKEFWANCSTHNYSLTAPGEGEDVREGVAFDTTTYFDELTSEDTRYLPPTSEKVDIKGYFNSLLQAFTHDPYSFIPDSMRPEGVSKVSGESVNYDFSNFTNVSNIHYGGFGEQWHMVIENIKESQRFYNITTYGSEIIGASNLVVSLFLDDYYDGTVSKTFNDDSRFISKIDFDGGELTYSIQYLSSIDVPLFGTLTPQIDMSYDVVNDIKVVRIQLGGNNALKFMIYPDSYSFGIEYSISEVSRKALFSVSKDEDENVEGHIYEFVQYKDKDLVPACADFYIGETYTSVVGNKARAITGFTGYINELYKTEEGKLLGYEIRETASFPLIGEKTYHTLWFNLNNISGINSVKAVKNGSTAGGIGSGNPYDVYLNNDSSKFEPTKNGLVASRKYDVELRKQYFYSSELEEFETDIPMMFIQADHDGYTNFTDFPSDIKKKSGITASVNLASQYLDKIQDDYATLIDIFIQNKDDINSDYIVDFIGSAQEIPE